MSTKWQNVFRASLAPFRPNFCYKYLEALFTVNIHCRINSALQADFELLLLFSLISFISISGKVICFASIDGCTLEIRYSE